MSHKSVRFRPTSSDSFASELQQRVNAYFVDRGISQYANAFMIFKTVFYLGGLLMCLALATWGPSDPWTRVAIWAALGYFAAGIGMNIGHDALHGSYSSNDTINRLIGHSFTLVGAHDYNWRVLHNVIHHSYTNIAGADGDLHPGPWFKFFHGDEGLKPFHRFQHLYALPLYALTSLVWVLKKDFDHIAKTSHYIYRKPKLPKYEYAFLVASKLGYFALFVGMPFVVGGYSIAGILGCFLLMHVVQGLFLAMFFQLGHIVEGPRVVYIKDGENQLDSAYRHHLLGTANFAPRNHLAAFVCGGLNRQIEHHLFPRVCHVHYPKIAPIVKEVAAKHGLPYHEYPTMRAAVASHFRTLKAMGRPVEQGEFVEEFRLVESTLEESPSPRA